MLFFESKAKLVCSWTSVPNHTKSVYIIKPQENARWRVMRYKGGLPPLMIYTTASWWYAKPAAWINKKGTFGRQKFLFCWWRQLDSNQWPLACQASTLTNWAMPPWGTVDIIHDFTVFVKMFFQKDEVLLSLWAHNVSRLKSSVEYFSIRGGIITKKRERWYGYG